MDFIMPVFTATLIYRGFNFLSMPNCIFEIAALNRSWKCDGILSHYRNFKCRECFSNRLLASGERKIIPTKIFIEKKNKKLWKISPSASPTLSEAFRHVCAMSRSIKEAVSCCHVEKLSLSNCLSIFSHLRRRIVEFPNVGRPL